MLRCGTGMLCGSDTVLCSCLAAGAAYAKSLSIFCADNARSSGPEPMLLLWLSFRVRPEADIVCDETEVADGFLDMLLELCPGLLKLADMSIAISPDNHVGPAFVSRLKMEDVFDDFLDMEVEGLTG